MPSQEVEGPYSSRADQFNNDYRKVAGNINVTMVPFMGALDSKIQIFHMVLIWDSKLGKASQNG